MTRTITLVMVVGVGFVSVAGAQTYFEDGFDGPTLDPNWNVMGAGSYSLTGGDLEFVTEKGGLVYDAEHTIGFPRHLFLVDPGSSLTEWSAVARVRCNTPDQMYESVSLIAYKDDDNYVRLGYNYGGGGITNSYLAEYAGNYIEFGVSPRLTHTDYFWIRLDRQGDIYTAYISPDSTTDPDAVPWTTPGSHYVDLGSSPRVGIGGWNYGSGPSGELAEFDYFRVGALLYRLTFWATSSRGLIGVDPHAENYEYPGGTEVTLTAYPFSGYFFKHWILYDPNYPLDANYAVTDSNNPIVVVMNSDRQVKAAFGCGSGIEQALPVLAILGVFCGVASWRRRR